MFSPLIITLVVLVLIITALAIDKIGPDVVLLAGLIVLVLSGSLSMEAALSGFANSSVITIGSLYIVGAGLRTTGAMEYISRLALGRPTARTSLMRLFWPVSLLSAFMNNTPLVAFFLPIIVQLAKRLRISPSKLLIPLSYSAILGGTVTLIGSSTNLSLNSILQAEYNRGQEGRFADREAVRPLGFFELTPVGLPIAVCGLVYLSTIGRRLLPDRQDLLEYAQTHPREYSVELILRENCPLAGKSIRESGLRELPGLYLYRIDRGSLTISPVPPGELILFGDILCFSGVADSVVDLQRIRGLDPVEYRMPQLAASTDGMSSLDSLEGLPSVVEAAPRQGRQLCEVVISPGSPLVGQRVRDAEFRTRYNAAIIAVHRSGEKLQQKIGQISLCAGDTLLVDANDDFLHRWRHSADFILVSGVDDSAPVIHERAWIALGIFAMVVLGMSFMSEQATLVAMGGAVLMLLTRCVRGQEGHRSIDLSILVLVAAGIGLSKALEASGAARFLADGILGQCARSVPPGVAPYVVLAVMYIMTVLLSELLNNNATATLMGTLALATAQQMQVNPRPLMIAVCIAASCAFATPIGYQTNLMVLNAGGYRFRDFVVVGLPLNCLCFVIAMIVIPLLWSF